ncbi:MAG: hypothetical protein HY515_00665 [Candidatus Aenigmarchaeota archaeon]|nr:hypothetical protein [Candidatus Aenigmarchaeota archaeon]
MIKMDVKYIEQSLETKPWVKAIAIIDPHTDNPVYLWGCGAGYISDRAKCLMDPSNELVSKKGKWVAGAWLDESTQELDLVYARDVGGYTFIVEAGVLDDDFAVKKKGAKSLANAAKRALKLAGLYHTLYENC